MKSLNCLILDDHPLVCVAIQALISELDCVDEVTTSTDASDAMLVIQSKPIDLLILDVNLGSYDGYDCYRRIKAKGYQGKVLFFSAEKSHLFSEMAFKIGADGYVCKSENHHILKDAVEGIANGYTFFKFKQGLSKRSGQSSLSNRETVVMNYLLQGKNNREIAEILSISDKTVSTYKKRIMDKFNVNNLVDLTRATTL